MPRKRKKKNDEPDTPETPPELQGDEFERLQHLEMPNPKLYRRNKKKMEEGKGLVRRKIEEVLDNLLSKKADEILKEKKKNEPDAMRMLDIFHDLWMGIAAEALFLTEDPMKCREATNIALQIRTCVALMCDPMAMKDSDDVVRANLDILLDDIERNPYLVNPTVRSALKELSEIDIPLALMNHRKELTGEEVDMQLAIIDITTGEVFWSDRHKVDGRKDMQGFLPVAPFYVGCVNYKTKVNLFSQTINEGGMPVLPGAKDDEKGLMKKCLKHLLISFRLGSVIAPHIISTDEEGRITGEE